MKISIWFLLFILNATTLLANPLKTRILFTNYKIHHVKTPDQIGLNILELTDASNQEMTSAPPILLVHGFAFNWNSWKFLGDMYRSAGFRVFIVNWRSHGQGATRSMPLNSSSDKDPRLSFHNLAAYDLPTMVNFVYEKSGRKKIIYQSHSMGGMMAHLAFAGVGKDESGKVTISNKRGEDYESKILAFIPIAVPVSMNTREFPGSRMMDAFGAVVGVNGDRTGMAYEPDSYSGRMQALRLTTSYNMYKLSHSLDGLMNLDQISLEEYSVINLYWGSNVSPVLNTELWKMKSNGFTSPDGLINYGRVLQADPTYDFYRTKIPTVMMSAPDDSLALIEEQDALCRERSLGQIRFDNSGHIDLVAGKKSVKMIFKETLSFVKILNQ